MADLSARYAHALFQLAKEKNLFDEFLQQAIFLRTHLKQDGAIDILTHPLITSAEKTAFVHKVFGTVVHQDFLGFLQLAITKNRENFILPALKKLIYRIKKARGLITARVISATVLTDQHKLQLSQKLSAKLGKQVEVNVIVDPSQIAGISVQVDGYFLDRTAKTMLRGMKESFR